MTFLVARAWGMDYLPTADAFSAIVTAAIEHRPWFDDTLWRASGEVKRGAVIRHLHHAYDTGRVWSVLQGDDALTDAQPHGILLVEDIRPGVDATCHFLFFDRVLANKRWLIRATMSDLFRRDHLHVLRVEIPTFAAKLGNFLRKALGFRFEGEWLGATTPEAERLSRRYHTMQYEGRWHDSLLLSLTADAHAAAMERYERPQDGTPQHQPDSGPSAAGNRPPDEPARRADDAGVLRVV